MIPISDDEPRAMDHLSRHAAWTHRLARSLVSDDTLAADIAQDAWVAALRRPPDTSAPLRPWFRRVVRHQLFNRARETKRRATRERLSGVPDGARSPEDVLGRTEIQSILVEAVTALSEPYRQIVLLRYFDDLSSTEISRKLNVPAATVRGRLKTALEELRARLDARCRGREEWLEAIGDLLDGLSGSGGGWAPSNGTARSRQGTRSRSDPASKAVPSASRRFVAAAAAAAAVVTVVSGVGWIASTRAKRHDDAAPVTGRTTYESNQIGEGAPAQFGDDERSGQAPLDGRATSPRAGSAPRQLAGEFRASSPGAAGTTKAPVSNRATRLAGTVQLEGLVRGADPLLDSAVGPGGGLANVVVRIVKGLAARYPVPAERVRVRLSSSTIAPQIRVAWYGQPIEITNLDPSSHDVSAIVGSSVVFNGVLSAGSTALIAAPAAAEVLRISRDGVPDAISYVALTDNPYEAVTNTNGRFVFRGLPPGSYTVMAWHERFGSMAAEARVDAGESPVVSLVFHDDPARRSARVAALPFGACQIATHGEDPVAKACLTGGRPAAKRAMKQLVATSRSRGIKFTCEGCHRDLDGYELTKNAQADFSKMLQVSEL